MPGGQYSNLFSQAKSLGLGDRYGEVKRMYQKVNMLFGDIVKVTPSSKVVGDMALFMVQNDLDEESVIKRGEHLDFPDSVVSFFKGEIGKPANGFNTELQKIVLKGAEPLKERAGKVLKRRCLHSVTTSPIRMYCPMHSIRKCSRTSSPRTTGSATLKCWIRRHSYSA